MKLENLIFDDPLKSTIYGERFLNDTKGRFEDYSEVDVRYDPQGPISHIDTPFTFLSKDQCVAISSSPSDEVMKWVFVGDECRFLWHPDVLRQNLEIHGTIKTQPTSSTRTLLTEDVPRVYIKTDLDKKHFRFIRRLKRSSVEHSIAICDDLRKIDFASNGLSRYAFLPESLGLVVQGGDYEGSGVIFRETKPYPHVSDERVMIPFHSLYADDPNYPEDKPLLVQLVNLHGRENALDYFVVEIVGPIIEMWVSLVFQRGLLPELHGQNTLAEFSKELLIERVVYRDFQGTYSDTQIRTDRGLSLFTKHKAGDEPGTTRQSQYSHVFDGMIGRYLLSRLSRVFCTHFAVEYDTVASAIKSYHHGLPNSEIADFPETTYRFATRAHEQVGNEVRFVDTGESPEFR